MRFYEYESRRILARGGIPLSKHGFAQSAEQAKQIAEDIDGPVVIKSQVLTGGRMRAGGVKFADTPEEAEAHAREILALEIGGHMPRGVLVDSRAAIKQEYYAGVIYDGVRKLPTFVFSDMGGIDIEEVAETHPDRIGRGHFSTILPHMDFRAKDVVASLGITGSELNRLTPILSNLARLFLKYDMTLAEINPLAQLEDGTFVAVDAHMEMENEGRVRQQELLQELGVSDEETRQAREPPEFEIEGERIASVAQRGGPWRRWACRRESPDRRGHHLHRPGHHRTRGGELDARVPRLRLEDHRRGDARPPRPRSARRSGVRLGGAARGRGRRRAGRLGGHGPARVHP